MPFGATQLPAFTWQVAGLTTASALASGLGNLCLVLAYRRAAASALAPLVYTQLIAAGILGCNFGRKNMAPDVPRANAADAGSIAAMFVPTNCMTSRGFNPAGATMPSALAWADVKPVRPN